jgi:hypothetical protein
MLRAVEGLNGSSSSLDDSCMSTPCFSAYMAVHRVACSGLNPSRTAQQRIDNLGQKPGLHRQFGMHNDVDQ